MFAGNLLCKETRGIYIIYTEHQKKRYKIQSTNESYLAQFSFSTPYQAHLKKKNQSVNIPKFIPYAAHIVLHSLSLHIACSLQDWDIDCPVTQVIMTEDLEKAGQVVSRAKQSKRDVHDLLAIHASPDVITGNQKLV